MFMCKPCHEKSKCKFFHFHGSFGPCESCKKVRECYDCHN